MTKPEIDDLIDRHFRAEERGDVEAAIADLSNNVSHELAGAHLSDNKEGARDFYTNLFGRLRLARIKSVRRLYGTDFAVDEALVEAETLAGEPAPFRLLHIFEFKDGQISGESAWRAPVGPGAERA